MFKLNESTQKKKFVYKERVAFFVYVSFIVMMTALRYTWLFAFFWREPLKPPREDKFGFRILASTEAVPVMLMSIVFSSLMY